MSWSCNSIYWSIALVAGLAIFSTRAAHADELLVFVSAFTTGNEAGIQAYRLNADSGSLQPAVRTGEMASPFFMALSANRKFLYAIHAPDGFGGEKHEQVAAYQIVGQDGDLKLLNRQSSHGTASCYLDVDQSGKSVLVANYSSGSVAALPVREDGSLGEAATFIQHEGSSVDSSRQATAHAHCFVISPDNRFAFAADLGLDKVLCYRLDSAHAKLSANRQPFVRTPPGAGPRHLTFDPQGKHVYVINEMANSVTMFDYQVESGMLSEQQTISTVPADFNGMSYCADLKITPDGQFLYGTNRGHDSIASYRIDDQGRLTLLTIQPSLGQGPQNLAITPNGKLLLCANMPGNNVVVFQIDGKSGGLTNVGEPTAIPSPSCIRIR